MLVIPTDKPTLTTAEIITQLTTSWGDPFTGYTGTWPSSMKTISYSINTAAPTNIPDYPATSGTYLVKMDALQVATAQLSFQLWDDLISKSSGFQHRLVQNSSPSANITLDYTSETTGGTYTHSTGTQNTEAKTVTLSAAQVWLCSSWISNGDSGMKLGGYGLETMLHEIGHALGLSHPGTYNGSATYVDNAEFNQDNRQYTIMSYFGGYLPGSGWQKDGTYLSYLYPQTPMVYDIAAIQDKYGADTVTRTGNTTYGFHCNLAWYDPEKIIYDFNTNHTPIFTIWDAGGTDTLDGSGYSGNQTINLTPGSYSSVDGMIENVAIAFNCFIENGIGGAGNDTLIAIGNNTLTGGKGADTFKITAGTNTITDLGVGSDVVIVSSGASLKAVVSGDFKATSATTNNGSASLDANGHDVNLALAGGVNGWIVTNSSSRGVALVGSSQNDSLIGGKGNDTISGGGGNDTLTGGGGHDKFVFTAAPDTSKNHDIVTDFDHSTDVLQFSKAVFATITNWKADEFWSHAGATAGHDGLDRIIYDTTTGNIYYDPDGSGIDPAVLVVTLVGTTSHHPVLTYTDIQLVA